MIQLASHRSRAALLLGTLLLLPAAAEGQGDARASGSTGTDRFGQPLPEGAVARLGAVEHVPGDKENPYHYNSDPQRGHTSGVYDLAFSPDGKLLASRSTDGQVYVWDWQRMEERFRVPGKRPIVWSRDGKLLAAGDMERGVNLWNAADGSQFGSLPIAGESGSQLLAFLPDGKRIAVLDEGDTSLYALDNLEKRLERYENGPSRPLSFSPDGRLIACIRGARSNPVVRLQNVRTGGSEGELLGSGYEPALSAFDETGRLFACGGQGKEPRVWEVETGERLFKDGFVGHQDRAWAVAFSPTGMFLASGGWDDKEKKAHTARVWDLSTGQQLTRFGDHSQLVMCVAFSPDGRYLASGSVDRTVLVWDVSQAILGAGGDGGPLNQEQLASLWQDLAAGEAGRWLPAVRRLSAAPDQSVPFFRAYVENIVPVDAAAQITKFIAQLDSDVFEERQEATLRLIVLSEIAEQALRDELVGTDSPEVHRRILDILQRDKRQPLISPLDERRLLRMTWVLQRINQPTTRDLLKLMAENFPSARVLKAAQHSLAGG